MARQRTLVGTCGYSYDEWRGTLYPEDLPKARFLEAYSAEFPFVELDYSWYAMPKASSLAAMAARVPPGFLFSLKAHRSLTHDRLPDWRERALELARAIEPLAQAGSLAALLIQLPYSFKRGIEERRYLAALCDQLAAFPLAIEFRNDEWDSPSVLEELGRRRAALVMVDRPDVPGLPPETAAVTAGLAYLRFHGRNAQAWWSGDARGRYDYLYSDSELAEKMPLIKEVEEKAELLLVAFNNHSRGRAVANARTLAAMLSERPA